MVVALLGSAFAAQPVTGLAIHPPKAGGLCPGETFEVVVDGKDAQGRASKLKLGSKAPVRLAWDIGPVDDRGTLTMPTDPREAWGKAGILTATLDANPSIHAEIPVPLRFDCAVTFDFTPAEGDVGDRGQDGVDNGTGRGGDGMPGQAGQRGRAGADLHVQIDLVQEPRTGVDVLQIEVLDLGDQTTRYAAVAPVGGQLHLVVSGGAGGRGGYGGAGGLGQTSNSATNNGRSGAGGDGGTGGNGGSIAVVVDPSAQGRAAKALAIENGGGPGGAGGIGGAVGRKAGEGLPAGTQGGNGSAGGPRAGNPGQPGVEGPVPEVHLGDVGALW